MAAKKTKPLVDLKGLKSTDKLIDMVRNHNSLLYDWQDELKRVKIERQLVLNNVETVEDDNYDSTQERDEELDLFQMKLDKLDQRENKLNELISGHQSLQPTKDIRKLAAQARSEIETKINECRDFFDGLLDSLQVKRLAYLRLVADLSSLVKVEQQARQLLGTANEFLPKKIQNTWVEGINAPINVAQRKGPIFFDQNDVVNTWQSGIPTASARQYEVEDKGKQPNIRLIK